MKYKIIVCLSALISTVARADYLDDKIAALTQQKQELIASLEECQKSTGKFKIAGIATLGVSAIGIGVNVAESKKMKEQDAKIAELEKTSNDLDLKLLEQKMTAETEQMKQDYYSDKCTPEQLAKGNFTCWYSASQEHAGNLTQDEIKNLEHSIMVLKAGVPTGEWLTRDEMDKRPWWQIPDSDVEDAYGKYYEDFVETATAPSLESVEEVLRHVVFDDEGYIDHGYFVETRTKDDGDEEWATITPVGVIRGKSICTSVKDFDNITGGTIVPENYTPVEEDESVDECACLCKITEPDETKWIYIGTNNVQDDDYGCIMWCSWMLENNNANTFKKLLKNRI